MKIDRKKLVDILKRVDAALASRDLIPAFACFCFDGKTVHAWDDVVALVYPASIGFVGAIRGKLALDWLLSSRAKEVDITATETQVLIKAGKSKFDTPVLPTTDFLFQAPDIQKGVKIEVDQKFLLALSRASLSMNNDPSNVWMYGVTLVHHQNGFEFFASNTRTVARAVIGKPTVGTAYILPPRFVDLLLGVSKNDAPKCIYLAKTWVSAVFSSGLKLYCKTVAGADDKDYRKAFANYSKKEVKAVPIPKTLAHCLQRALLPLSFAKEPYTELKIAEGRLRLHSKSPAGDVRDSMPIESEDIDLMLEPAVLIKVLPHAESISFFPDAFQLVGKNYTCLVATVSDATEHAPAAEETEEE